MRLHTAAAGLVVGIALLATTTFSAGALDKPEYAARRSRLMEKIGDGAAVFLGAPAPASDNAFRQGHDLFYLTGVEIPDAFLPVDGLRKESVLFFTMSEAAADGEAIPLDLMRAPAAYTGIERVLPADQFSAQLAGLANRGRPRAALIPSRLTLSRPALRADVSLVAGLAPAAATPPACYRHASTAVPKELKR
jgi:hypothetical protein